MHRGCARATAPWIHGIYAARNFGIYLLIKPNVMMANRALNARQDVLVVTAPGSGAEIIPFLKTWVNLPAAIGFTILYAKVSYCKS